MIRLRTSPASGGLVATLATGCGRNMGCRLAGGYCAVVAAGAARADCHVNVKFRWCPSRITLVAGRAVGSGTDVVRRLASSVGAVMAA